jgi:hypothetical protein
MQILIELCEDVNGCPPTSKADKYMINLLDKLREVYDDICQEIKIAVEHKPRNNKLINKLSRKEEILWKMGIWLQKWLGIYINDYMVGGYDGTKGVYNGGRYTKGSGCAVSSRGRVSRGN